MLVDGHTGKRTCSRAYSVGGAPWYGGGGGGRGDGILSHGSGSRTMPEIIFSRHALEQLADRGTSEQEVEEAIASGERTSAHRGRIAYRKNLRFGAIWREHYYETKQVMPIVKEEDGRLIVVTVYVFYIGGRT